MITVVAIGPIAVTTNYWEEYQEDGTEEIGCRVQLRRLREVPSEIPPPQPRRDATWWHIDEPIWRADLFTTVGSVTPLDASHYHPTFTGVQPCERVFDPTIFPDPHAWMVRRLSDLRGMLEEAGHPDLAAEIDEGDLAQAMPAILSAIATTLTYRPAHRAHVPA
jgi:hypothetical protein